jgi:hypothetical protein
VKRYCDTLHYLKIVTAFTMTGALIRTVEARGSCWATRIPPVARYPHHLCDSFPWLLCTTKQRRSFLSTCVVCNDEVRSMASGKLLIIFTAASFHCALPKDCFTRMLTNGSTDQGIPLIHTIQEVIHRLNNTSSRLC